MTQFLVEYRDADKAELREAHRPDHVAYRKGLGEAIRLAGPILDDAGKPIGSLIILEASDRSEAERLASNDPYLSRGVFELVSVRPYRIVAMKPLT